MTLSKFAPLAPPVALPFAHQKANGIVRETQAFSGSPSNDPFAGMSIASSNAAIQKSL
jgi:hypothetical protein